MSFNTPVAQGPVRRRSLLKSTGKGLLSMKQAPFKSPIRTPTAPKAKPEETEETLSRDIRKLEEREKELDLQIEALLQEGYREEELGEHIEKLHQYNETKDIGQMLLGRIAELKGTTTRELYTSYGLDLND